MKERENYIRWTREELDLLSSEWPKGGLRRVRPLFPHRNDKSLQGRASMLGLRIEARRKKHKYEPSEFIDAAIKREYSTGKRPDLKSLAERTGRPRGWLKYRAAVLGVHSEWFNGRAWMPEEDVILDAGIDAGASISAIRKRLERAGWSRSISSIASRIEKRKLGYSRPWMSMNETADLMGVDIHKVAVWVNAGLLKAERRHGNSNPAPNDAERKLWAITRQSLRHFMLEYPERWDHRKLSKTVLLDLLCNDFNAVARRAAEL